MKKALILAAAVLVSCRLIPEIEGPYPTSPGPRFPQIIEDEDKTKTPLTESGGTAEAAAGTEESGETSDEVSVFLPEEEPFQDEGEMSEFPDAVLELGEADYPELDPEGETIADPGPPADQIPPPPESALEIEQAPPDQPPPPPPPVRETPPPPPPITVRPAEPSPPPPQERETPSVSVPDIPFQPVSPVSGPAESDLPYSRTVRALAGQYIEIPFRGPGWVYLGEFGSRRGISYDSRRMDDDGMTFVFRADAAGTYSLRFNRQDFVRDLVSNDYVKVIVEQPPSDSQGRQDRVYAGPRWPLAVDPSGTARVSNAGEEISAGQNITAPAQSGAAQPAAVQPAAGQPASAQPNTLTVPEEAQTAAAVVAVPAEDWLKKAREEYDAGRIANALGALDQYMIHFPAGSDEAFWLYGQSLEANNEATRNIRFALDYYRRLVQEYPQSTRYDEAQRRIAYLERFYFSIQ